MERLGGVALEKVVLQLACEHAYFVTAGSSNVLFNSVKFRLTEFKSDARL
jgi:hypothetical protein